MADNRRVRMTKKLIKDAYLELLEKRPSERISVTDICKTADVNRSTFYMYYEDTIRLRQDIENDVLAQIPVLTDGSAPVTTDRQFVALLERFFPLYTGQPAVCSAFSSCNPTVGRSTGG